jgi:hypothetical protein
MQAISLTSISSSSRPGGTQCSGAHAFVPHAVTAAPREASLPVAAQQGHAESMLYSRHVAWLLAAQCHTGHPPCVCGAHCGHNLRQAGKQKHSTCQQPLGQEHYAASWAVLAWCLGMHTVLWLMTRHQAESCRPKANHYGHIVNVPLFCSFVCGQQGVMPLCNSELTILHIILQAGSMSVHWWPGSGHTILQDCLRTGT